MLHYLYATLHFFTVPFLYTALLYGIPSFCCAPLQYPFFMLHSFTVPFLYAMLLYGTLSLCYALLWYPFFMLRSFTVPFLYATLFYGTLSLRYALLRYPFFTLCSFMVPFLYATLFYGTLSLLYALCSMCYALRAMLYPLMPTHAYAYPCRRRVMPKAQEHLVLFIGCSSEVTRVSSLTSLSDSSDRQNPSMSWLPTCNGTDVSLGLVIIESFLFSSPHHLRNSNLYPQRPLQRIKCGGRAYQFAMPLVNLHQHSAYTPGRLRIHPCLSLLLILGLVFFPHTVMDPSFEQDPSVEHFKFLTQISLNCYQINYMMSCTTP